MKTTTEIIVLDEDVNEIEHLTINSIIKNLECFRNKIITDKGTIFSLQDNDRLMVHNVRDNEYNYIIYPNTALLNDSSNNKIDEIQKRLNKYNLGLGISLGSSPGCQHEGSKPSCKCVSVHQCESRNCSNKNDPPWSRGNCKCAAKGGNSDGYSCAAKASDGISCYVTSPDSPQGRCACWCIDGAKYPCLPVKNQDGEPQCGGTICTLYKNEDGVKMPYCNCANTLQA